MKRAALLPTLFGAGILTLLYLASLRNYLLFHSLAEVFSIVIAFSIFIIAWNSRQLIENAYLLFLGTAYLFVGSLDLIHTLGYTGMGVFPGSGTNLATQLWVAARYMESLSILLAIFFLGRRLRVNPLLAGYSAVLVAILASVFYWRNFPVCFVEGQGLTVFKRTSEYVISGILLGSIVALVGRRRYFDPGVLRLLVASVALTIASEIAFTFYIHAYGFSNLVGHFLKIVSFYLVYKALIETGLRQPLALLFREINQRERALSEAYVELEQILNTASDGVRVVDAEYTVVQANRIHCEMLGLGEGEVIGKRCYETFPGTRCNTPSCPLERILAGEGRIEFEEDRRLPGGGVLSCIVTATAFKDTQGNTIAIAESFKDISERKRSEVALRESERKFRALAEHAPDMIARLDCLDRFLYVNPAMRELVGTPQHELVGKTPREASLPMSFAAILSRSVREVCRSAKVQRAEVALTTADGKRYLRLTAVPEVQAEGVVSTVLAVASDITELKEAEAITRRDKETLELLVARRSEELLEAHKRLADAERLSGIGMLAATVAHELRNPLGVIQTAIFNIRRKSKEAALERHLANIEKKISESDIIISNLLRYSRIRSPQIESVSLFDLLEESLASAADRFPDHKVEVETDLEPLKHKRIDLDPVQIREVFDNIFNNAYQAVDETEGRIEVSGRVDRGGVSVRIRDNGPGIIPKDIEHVFEPFFTKKSRGTGLGLTICRELLKLHGGTVSMESQPGRGTSVAVTLPTGKSGQKGIT